MNNFVLTRNKIVNIFAMIDCSPVVLQINYVYIVYQAYILIAVSKL